MCHFTISSSHKQVNKCGFVLRHPQRGSDYIPFHSWICSWGLRDVTWLAANHPEVWDLRVLSPYICIRHDWKVTLVFSSHPRLGLWITILSPSPRCPGSKEKHTQCSKDPVAIWVLDASKNGRSREGGREGRRSLTRLERIGFYPVSDCFTWRLCIVFFQHPVLSHLRQRYPDEICQLSGRGWLCGWRECLCNPP